MADIARILSSAGVKVQHAPAARVRHGWIGVDCPRCSSGSGKFRLGFTLNGHRASCWVCGGFYPPEILAQLLRITTREAFDLLGAPDRRRAAETNLRIGTLKIPQGVGPLLPAHRAYLKKRGLNPDLLASVWGFRGIGIAPRLQWRIWIPICDLYGKVVSWTTRSIGDDPPTRYISATADEEELPHRSILFGAHLARHVIIVCEGALDAVTIGPGAVATCGVGFSKAQKAAMAEYPVRVVCFDAEDDAQKRARALCNDLSAFPGSTENVYFDSAKDANSADRAEVDELRKKYLPESLEIAA